MNIVDKRLRHYALFLFGSAFSQLGSAMSAFALILWAFSSTKRVLVVSMMSFCSYLPYIAVSLFCGGLIDRTGKVRILLGTDALAAAVTLFVLLAEHFGGLQIGHIYLVNLLYGAMNSLQSPASAVVLGQLVEADLRSQASGMDSFAEGLCGVLSPMLAAALFALGGLKLVLLIDLISFAVNFVILKFFVKITEPKAHGSVRHSSAAGFAFLFKNKGLLLVILSMAILNFFSRLTYENILSPMLLSRSNGDSAVLGLVNAVMGAGGILGGILVSLRKKRSSAIKRIFFSAALSFLLGDLLMGLSRGTLLWCAAALLASLPIPNILAGQRVILYATVPPEISGSVFAARNALQFFTVPIGLLLGGVLADRVFEPFMRSGAPFAAMLGKLVGSAYGSGMAVMFLCSGLLGSAASLLLYRNKAVQGLSELK